MVKGELHIVFDRLPDPDGARLRFIEAENAGGEPAAAASSAFLRGFPGGAITLRRLQPGEDRLAPKTYRAADLDCFRAASKELVSRQTGLGPFCISGKVCSSPERRKFKRGC